MSNINKTHVNKLRRHIEERLKFIEEKNLFAQFDDAGKKTRALSMVILSEYYRLSLQEAADCLTDGSRDNKFDAIYFSHDPSDCGELVIVQSKYKEDCGSNKTLTEDEIKLTISNCEKVLNGKELESANAFVKEKISQWRETLEDNNSANIENIAKASIKIVFVTNGVIHEGHKNLREVKKSQDKSIEIKFIDVTNYEIEPFAGEGVLRVDGGTSNKQPDTAFKIPERDEYKGYVKSCTLENLMTFYRDYGKEQLLDANVRFRLRKSTINDEILESFKSEPEKFCYLNNGISIVCDSISLDYTGREYRNLTMSAPNIINGGQTIATLYNLFESEYSDYKKQFGDARIIVRAYQVPDFDRAKIAKATNSQNPINVVDLHSNDASQKFVKKEFEKKGVGMLIKRGEDIEDYDDTVRNEFLLQLYASMYEGDPATAKTSKMSTFKKYYSTVFNESIDEDMSEKLYRCYEINRYLSACGLDKELFKHGQYALIYILSKTNEDICDVNVDIKGLDLSSSTKKAVSILKKIIKKKQGDLKEKFSLNNLFKNQEIKDLIDIELEK